MNSEKLKSSNKKNNYMYDIVKNMEPFYMLNSPQIIKQIELVCTESGELKSIANNPKIVVNKSRFLGKEFFYYEDEEGFVWTSLPLFIASGTRLNNTKDNIN